MSGSSSLPTEKCPVDHSQLRETAQADKCPVDHKSNSSPWNSLFSSRSNQSTPESKPATLPTDREVSSIPRLDGENWVYPSQAQFYAAMARKQHNPQGSDMRVVVPIHNAVNERAWGEVLHWERGWGGEKCGGVKLVSFKGRPGDMSPKARWKSLVGYVTSVLMDASFLVSPLLSSLVSLDTKRHLIDMIGLLIGVGRAYAMLLIFMPEKHLQVAEWHSTLIVARR